MAQKTIQGNETLARQIKARRNELGLTIEEAASRAGVGTKTWCRYEAGESIRVDKCKGICKALNWHIFPEQDTEIDDGLSILEYKKSGGWSDFLESTFGASAAMSFAVGSELLLDRIKEDLAELASMPAKSHLGQLSVSLVCDSLPTQFLMYYDYDFLYQMKCTLLSMRVRAKCGLSLIAHSVMQELILYLCSDATDGIIELCGEIKDPENNTLPHSTEWVFDLFGDMDIITFLYSDVCIPPDHPYHFSHWNDQQFYVD